jgi:hypothetical protein
MPIIVKKIEDDLYSVSATLPDVDEEWLPAEPVRGRQLVRELKLRGGHQLDIGDAMNRADPDWIKKLRDPFIPNAWGRIEMNLDAR